MAIHKRTTSPGKSVEHVPTGTKPGTNPVQKNDGRSFLGQTPTSRGPIPAADKEVVIRTDG